ncbi:hypothetical protein GGX14DRAFT_667167 [Mycena pura]|uniref:Uncharacterized protein n=1 Tax=Mycena pura TaxID=153505 RepID=A0AAD6Y3V6_9AGAR|nr:hypothetical protein GGX14DRAFT_667167 [Mycena pura]
MRRNRSSEFCSPPGSPAVTETLGGTEDDQEGGALAFTMGWNNGGPVHNFFLKLYSHESSRKAGMVATVWTLDVAQSAFILASLFHYFVEHFGAHNAMEAIPWSIVLNVVLRREDSIPLEWGKLVDHWTHRASLLLKSSPLWLQRTQVCLAWLCLRGSPAPATARVNYDMEWLPLLQIDQWVTFPQSYQHYLFTVGLLLSAGTDMLITACLCYYLRQVRRLVPRTCKMKGVWTLNLRHTDGSSLVFHTPSYDHQRACFLALDAVSLGLHFTIGKCAFLFRASWNND